MIKLLVNIFNMFRNSRSQNIVYEQQAKFIQDRINLVEKNFSELCSVMGEYTRKTARLRDKGDEMAKILQNFAETEEVNKSLSNALAHLSTTISAIEDYRNAKVQRLETKVIGELSQYDTICKHAREELKHTMSVRDREVARKRVLDRAKERNPLNRQQISYAEAELLKASAEMFRTAKSLEEQTDFFEKRKLLQVKAILSDFVLIEIAFHAKALELLTIGHHQLNEMDDRADLQEFRKKLHSPERLLQSNIQPRSSSLASVMQQQRSKSLDSIDSIKNKDSDKSNESEEESFGNQRQIRSNSFY